MKIGVPKEIKNNEFRVGLTPDSVYEVVGHGHQVVLERGAGAGIGADDVSYKRAGAHVVDFASAVFENADLIVKVKEPLTTERAMLRAGQVLFTYLHLASDVEQTRGLVPTILNVRMAEKTSCSVVFRESMQARW
jgi:alanine dehydrogenase